MTAHRLGRIAFLALALAVTAAPPAGAQKKRFPPFKAPDTIEVLRDVEFGTGGGRPLKLHLLRPKVKPEAPMPVLVWIHGGGWERGSRDSGLWLLSRYAERGYLGASIEYRLSGEAPFPAQIEDCKCAIRFLRAKAKDHHLDPERIGVWGSSAGGHLAALLGTSGHVKELEGKGGWDGVSSRVRAVCDFCGPTDFLKIVGDSERAEGPVVRLLGGPPAMKKDLARLASPLTHVTRDAPPFFIVHGDQDRVVPLDQSELLAAALKKAGGRVTLHVAKGLGHGLGGPQVMGAVREFFDRELRAAGK